MPPESGAARKPVDPDLLPQAVPHHLGRHLRALHQRRAGLHRLAVAREQHTVKGDRAPRFGGELRDLEGQARLGLELAAADRKDGVGHGARKLDGHLEPVKGPLTPRRIAR